MAQRSRVWKRRSASQEGHHDVAQGPAHHRRARDRRGQERADLDVAGEGRLHVVRGELPERLGGHQEAGGDPDVAGGGVSRHRPDLLHPAAHERQAVEAEDGDAVGEVRQPRPADEGEGQEHGALEKDEAEPQPRVRRGGAPHHPGHRQHPAAQHERVDGEDRPAAEPLAEGDRRPGQGLGAQRLDDPRADLAGQGVHGHQHRGHHDQEVGGVERGEGEEVQEDGLLGGGGVGADVAAHEVEPDAEEDDEGGAEDERRRQDPAPPGLGEGEPGDDGDDTPGPSRASGRRPPAAAHPRMGASPITSRKISSSDGRRAAKW